MSVIQSLKIRDFRLSCSHPFQSAVRTIKQRHGYLFCIKTDSEMGLGEASPLPNWTESFRACGEALRHTTETIRMKGVDRAIYEVRDTPAARHAVSLACQDLKAKRDDLPLYKLLRHGSQTVDSVPVHATIGDGTPEETARMARQKIKQGFKTVKVKVGNRPVEEELTRLKGVRNELGSAMNLRVDANGSWNKQLIEERLDELQSLDFEFIEQPLPADNLEDHAAIREFFTIAVDETLYEHDLETIVNAGAADIIILKPMCIGGLDRCMDYAESVMNAGLVPVVTTTIDAVVARTAAVHLAAAIGSLPACGLATGEFLDEDLCEDPAPVDNGRINVPQSRGIGVDEAWTDSQ